MASEEKAKEYWPFESVVVLTVSAMYSGWASKSSFAAAACKLLSNDDTEFLYAVAPSSVKTDATTV